MLLEKVLQQWIVEVIKGEKWENFDDIHIDEISKSFKDRKTWLPNSLCAFDCLISLLDITKYEVILVIPLRYSKKSYNINKIKYIEDIKYKLDLWTPPSLYFFPINGKKWENTKNDAMRCSRLSEKEKYITFYREYKDGEDYNRSLLLSNNVNFIE